MSQSNKQINEIEVMEEYLSPEFLRQVGDLEAVIEESNLTPREYLCYVLAEVSDNTGHEAADIMGITEGTYWGKLGRVREKIDEAELTLELGQPA